MLSQSYSNFELLICDDSSSDNSILSIQNIEDKRIIILSNDKNEGYLNTCNRLFKEAKGDIITFQDADDWSTPDRLKLIVEAFRENSEAGVCLSYYNTVNEGGQLIEERQYDLDFKAFANNAEYWMYFCGASIAIRREVYESVGGYQLYFDRKGGEDYDWLFRISRQFEGVQIQKALYNYRLHGSAVKLNGGLERYYIMDLINAGRKLMIEEGKDYLAPENEDWLDEQVKTFEQRFKKDASLQTRATAIGKLNAKKYMAAMGLSFKAVTQNPAKFYNWIFPLYVFYLMLRRVIKL